MRWDIYDLLWLLRALIMEPAEFHMVLVKEILGCSSHCNAPRYQETSMVNPGGIKEELTGCRQMKVTVKTRLFIRVGAQRRRMAVAFFFLYLYVGINGGDLFQKVFVKRRRETLMDFVTFGSEMPESTCCIKV